MKTSDQTLMKPAGTYHTGKVPAALQSTSDGKCVPPVLPSPAAAPEGTARIGKCCDGGDSPAQNQSFPTAQNQSFPTAPRGIAGTGRSAASHHAEVAAAVGRAD
jgi:hypothetical protein